MAAALQNIFKLKYMRKSAEYSRNASPALHKIY